MIGDSRSPSPTSPTCRRTASSSPSCRSGTSWISSPSRRGSYPRSTCGWSPKSTDLIEESGAGRRRARRRRRTGRSKSAPSSSSAPTAGTRSSASAPGFEVEDSARRSTCCGCASRHAPDRPRSSRSGRFDRGPDPRDASTAATTGSAASSSPKAASTRSQQSGPPAFRADIAAHRAVPRATASTSSRLGRRQAPDRRRRPPRSVVRPGLLCIGDAAHAMSPVGGVGINLAIQDAVAAANILAEPLSREK